MACADCKNRGIIHDEDTDLEPYIHNGYKKLIANDWLKNYESRYEKDEIVEIRFKNTHKGYFINEAKLQLKTDDAVAVEVQRGHDIGTVSLTGKLVLNQLRKRNVDINNYKFAKIYRKATRNDLRVWSQSIEREQPVLHKARKIIREMELDMKLSEVEFQGDGSKAIFYYIADERVDFRELIKVLAKEFHIRIEMRQIGARQEAGMIGGLGSCGRELCCSSWKTNFQSIPLNSAKIQELPANVQKLAGPCGKIKCCMIYEIDTYMEAREDIPKILLELETVGGVAFHQKTDILNRIMYYSYTENSTENLIAVPVNRVKEIISLNKKGIKAESLIKEMVRRNDVDYISKPDPINRFDRIHVRNEI